jgi:hypothetical protein
LDLPVLEVVKMGISLGVLPFSALAGYEILIYLYRVASLLTLVHKYYDPHR